MNLTEQSIILACSADERREFIKTALGAKILSLPVLILSDFAA